MIPLHLKFFFRLFLGNAAAFFWFCPYICKLLYSINGVKFLDPKTVFISKGVVLDNRYPDQLKIGRDVWLTRNVVILSHSYSSFYQEKHFGLKEKISPVVIEDGVFIGMGSIILPGVTLGKGSYIGAGSVVTKSIPHGMLATGNPCRVIRQL